MEPPSTSKDLLIIGAGRLAKHLSPLWLKQYPSAKIHGETLTTDNHKTLQSFNIIPHLVNGTPSPTPSYIIFCVPLSVPSLKTYVSNVQSAVKRASECNSRLVFTSSGTVHGSKQPLCKQDVPVCFDESEPRARVLSTCEKEVLNYNQGIVVRFAGLYEDSSPPHENFIRGQQTVVPFPSSSQVNMLHYTDAASAVMKTLLTDNLVNNIFIVASTNGISIKRLWEMGINHPRRLTEKHKIDMPDFTEDAKKPGWKQYDCSLIKSVLNWEPLYETYEDYYKHDTDQFEN